jgi:hypothetical protein
MFMRTQILLKLLMIGLLSVAFALYACSDDSVSGIDDDPPISDPDPDPDPDPDDPEYDEALFGIWVLDPTPGSLAVGPAPDDLSWWAVNADDIEARHCQYDDLYIFHSDGTFENDLGDETWLEGWQSDEEGCGPPVAPHDGSTPGEWFTENDAVVTLMGEGIFLGLPKVHNTAEDGNPEDDTIVYNYEVSNDGGTLEVRIDGWHPDMSEATWYFRFIKYEEQPEIDPDLVGSWTLDPTAGSLAVGPAPDDLSWWAVDDDGVEERHCQYDDLFIFHENGTFENDLGDETWLEDWQADEQGCGTPVAPHDGSTPGNWTADGVLVTLMGEGVFLGLPKVHNTAEDGMPEDDTIIYNYEVSDRDDDRILEVTIDGWNPDMPEATWYFRFLKQ